MKAPNISTGKWHISHDGHGGISIEHDAGKQIGFVSAGFKQDANAKLVAAAPMLAESLAELVSLERERARLFGHELFPSALRAIDALKAAGYEE